jgi:hypothetical protein
MLAVWDFLLRLDGVVNICARGTEAALDRRLQKRLPISLQERGRHASATASLTPLARIIHKIAVSSCKSLFYNGYAQDGYCNDGKETAMAQDTQIMLPFASLAGKHLQADVNGGTLSSDGGVLFLREIEARVGVIRRFVKPTPFGRPIRLDQHTPWSRHYSRDTQS